MKIRSLGKSLWENLSREIVRNSKENHLASVREENPRIYLLLTCENIFDCSILDADNNSSADQFLAIFVANQNSFTQKQRIHYVFLEVSKIPDELSTAIE
jgi:hypothetical protein